VAEITSCIFYKLQVDRGPSITGDGAISPCSTSEVEQTTTGSPLRHAGDPNRGTTINYNMDYQSVTAGGDTYQTYLVDSTNPEGANDIATVDPGFVGGAGTYAWDETSILNGSETVSDTWTEIRAFYTPTAAQLDGTGSGGVDVGAVDVQTDVVAPVLVSAAFIDATNVIELTYDEAIDPTSEPAAGAFTVTGVSVTGVANDGSTKFLITVNANPSPGATISYTAGGSPIQDLAGNDAANLTNQAISGVPAGGSAILYGKFGFGIGF
jgi:hypothetical protein